MSETDFYHRADGGKYFDGEDYKGDGILLNAMIFGAIGMLAGQKFYAKWRPYANTAELTGASIRQGAYCAYRWKVWFATAVWTVVSIPVWMILGSGVLDLFYPGDPDYTWEGQDRLALEGFTKMFLLGHLSLAWLLLALQLVIGLFAVGVTYNLNVRESLFQERWFFRAMRPLERITPKVHWSLLHCLVVVPLVMMITFYNH